MKGAKTFLVMVFMLLAVTAFAHAEEQNNNTDNDNNNNNTDADAQEKILNNSMEVRYEHLQCKIVFTNDQITLFDKYLPEDNGLIDHKKILKDDLDELKNILDDGNRILFDNYTTDTLRPDLVNATQALNKVKKDFRIYNITSENREKIKDELKALKDTYNDCVSDKTRKMAEIHKQHYELTDKRWENIIKNMNKINISTEQLEQIRTTLHGQEQMIDDVINSGNQTLIIETLTKILEENKHLWANFEISRLNGYMNKMNNMAQKYGMSDKMKEMKDKLDDLKNYTESEYKYKEGDARKVWQGLEETGKDMRNTSKEMLKQRVQEQKQLKDEQKNGEEGNQRGRK